MCSCYSTPKVGTIIHAYLCSFASSDYASNSQVVSMSFRFPKFAFLHMALTMLSLSIDTRSEWSLCTYLV